MPIELEALLNEFQASLGGKVNPATARGYRTDILLFARWFEQSTGEPFRPSALLRHDLLVWREQMAQAVPSASLNRRLSSLRSFFAWAQERGLVSLDPTRQVQSLPAETSRGQAPALEALELLLREARLGGDARERALLELLVGTGLRLKELAALRLADLELGPGSGWVTLPGEAGGEPRRLAIPARARLACRDYLAGRPQAQASEPAFLDRRGHPISPFTIWYTVRKYALRANQPGLTPRVLRQSLTIRLTQDPQVGLLEAASQLGYRHPESLVRYLKAGSGSNPAPTGA